VETCEVSGKQLDALNKEMKKINDKKNPDAFAFFDYITGEDVGAHLATL